MKHKLSNGSRYVSFFFLRTPDDGNVGNPNKPSDLVSGNAASDVRNAVPHRRDEEANASESKYDQIEMLEANNLGLLTEMSEAFRFAAKTNNIEIVESVVAYRPRHSNPAQSKHSVWRTL